ncbi:MAG: hypothetical protein AB7T18_07405 [Alphaproteobacteria bacterium]
MYDDDHLDRITLGLVKRFGAGAVHIARELDRITDALPDVPRAALKMVECLGIGVALHTAQEMADLFYENALSGEVWSDIADAIERIPWH